MNKRSNRVWLALILSVSLAACGGDDGPEGNQWANIGEENQNQEEELPTDEPAVLGTYTHQFDEGPRTFDLIRLPREGDGFAYIMWTPPLAQDQPAPVMVVAQPYDGVDWTREEVDERWANRGQGSFADVDGPDYDPATSAQIGYNTTPLGEIADAGNIWLLNGMGVAFVFGRFYAGETLDGYVRSMVAALEFVGDQDGVDVNRVGTFGISWGGFMAVYGAAYAPDNLGPVAATALFPPIDFEEFLDYMENQIEENFSGVALQVARNVFEPFIRRVRAGMGELAGPGFDGYRAQDICDRLQAPVLVLHDEYDTLVPFAPVRQFADDCEWVNGVWYTHEEPIHFASRNIDHGPMFEEGSFPTALTFATANGIQALNAARTIRFTLIGEAAMLGFLQDLQRLQDAGEPVDWAVDPLLNLVAPGMNLLRMEDFQVLRGAEIFADLIETVFGVELAENEVAGWIAGLE